MIKKANFIFIFDTTDEAKVVSESLMPEIKHKIPKTNAKLSCDGNRFLLEIQADDVSSLRAACNSYLRWINTALDVKRSV